MKSYAFLLKKNIHKTKIIFQKNKPTIYLFPLVLIEIAYEPFKILPQNLKYNLRIFINYLCFYIILLKKYKSITL